MGEKPACIVDGFDIVVLIVIIAGTGIIHEVCGRNRIVIAVIAVSSGLTAGNLNTGYIAVIIIG